MVVESLTQRILKLTALKNSLIVGFFLKTLQNVIEPLKGV